MVRTHEGKTWELTIQVKVRGQEQLQSRPALNGCQACYTIYMTYFGQFDTWDVYCKKYWSDKEYTKKADDAEKIIKCEMKASWDMSSVHRRSGQDGVVRRSQLALTERDLRNASQLAYIPKEMLKGP